MNDSAPRAPSQPSASSEPSAADPQSPRVSETGFGRYERLFRIAAGGMAEVFAARVSGEAGFEKLVAIKSMLPSVAEDPQFVAMFLDEGRLVANISHPNVVSTLDLGRNTDGGLYLVMDLVVGVTLAHLLRQSTAAETQIPLPLAIELLAQVADGLDAAHSACTPLGEPLGIVHRDVSPQNILVGIDGRIRITDFGVARAVQRVSQTTGGQFKGKFSYAAPEQIRGQAVDARTDVFGLGIVAWETLTGRRLFAGETPAESIAQVLSGEVTDLRKFRPEISEDIAKIITSCLAGDPNERPASAGEVATQLRATLGGSRPRPSAADIRTFVTDHGGQTLESLQTNLHESLTDDDSPDPQTTIQVLDSELIEVSTVQKTAVDATPERTLVEHAESQTTVWANEPQDSTLTPRAPRLSVDDLASQRNDRSTSPQPRSATSRAIVVALLLAAAGAFYVSITSTEPPIDTGAEIELDVAVSPASRGLEATATSTTPDSPPEQPAPPPSFSQESPLREGAEQAEADSASVVPRPRSPNRTRREAVARSETPTPVTPTTAAPVSPAPEAATPAAEAPAESPTAAAPSPTTPPPTAPESATSPPVIRQAGSPSPEPAAATPAPERPASNGPQREETPTAREEQRPSNEERPTTTRRRSIGLLPSTDTANEFRGMQ